MISINFRFEPPFNEITNKTSITLKFEEELTLKDLIHKLRDRYGDRFYDLIWDKKDKNQFSSFLSIIINGRSYRDENFLNTILKNGDDMSFLYLYFGG